MKMASANPQDGYICIQMDVVYVLAGDKKIKSYEVACKGMKAS
jgi:hypothetical protein